MNSDQTGLSALRALWRRHGLAVLSFFSFAGGSVRYYVTSNENDVLYYARHFVQPSFLKNDWYLATQTQYRYAFNWLVGPLLCVFPTWAVALGGRMLVAALIAGLVAALARQLKLSGIFLAPFVVWFGTHQSMAAGEWITQGGFETKTLAYFFAFGALLFSLKRRYRASSIFAGLSLTFHVLVGASAIGCLMLAYALDRPRFERDRSAMLRSLPLIPLFGAFGCYAIWRFLVPDHALSASDSRLAARVYVLIRNPHHTFPPYFPPGAAFRYLGAFVFFLVCALSARRREPRLLYVFCLAAFIPCALGYLVYASGHFELLRFYWFRFPDTAAPFFGMFFAAFLLRRAHRWSRRRGKAPIFVMALWLALGASITVAGTRFGRNALERWRLGAGNPPAKGTQDGALAWIRDNTPVDSVILHSGYAPNVYLTAERAQFASFKHVPADARDVVEWYRRLVVCNNGVEPPEVGYAIRSSITKNFPRIPAETVRRIARENNIDYLVGRRRTLKGAKQVYDDGAFRVYDLRPWKS